MLVDPKVYDSPEFDAKREEQVTQARANYTAPDAVPQESTLVGQASTAGAFVQQEQNRRQEVSVGTSLDAAIDEMSPMAMYRKLSGPTFTPDVDFNAGTRMQHVPMQLSKDDREFLLESRSNEEFDYKVGNIDRWNRNNRLMGDNAAASFGMMMLDPSYLMIDVAAAGAGHLAAVANIGRVGQRLTVGGTAALGAVGVMQVEAATRPMSTTEVVAGALLNGAASTAFYSPVLRRIEKLDPEFPDVPLRNVANNARVEPTISNEVAEAVPVYNGKFKANPVQEGVPGSGTTAKAALLRMGSDTDPLMSTMANRLSAMFGDADVPIKTVPGLKQSHYDLGTGEISMREGASDWVQMHEIAHSLTAERLRYGRANPESALGKVAVELDNLQRTVLEAAKAKGKDLDGVSKYLAGSTDELMAGLYSGSKEFYDFLRSVPVEGGNALNKFVDTIRRVLGIPASEVNALTKALGLTDDLMQKPLKVRTTAVDPNGVHSTFTRDLLHEPPSEPSKLAAAIIDNEDKTVPRIAKGLSWSLHKSLGKFSPEMRKAADLLVDDPLNMTGDSVVSQTRAIRADLAPLQYRYEDALKAKLASAGFGLRKRIMSPTQALKAQGVIEKQVALEMLAREQNARLGRVHQPHADKDIKAMADSLDAIAKASLAEMKASGVRGAEDVMEGSGYFSRRWDIGKIEGVEKALMDSGLTEGAARSRVVRAVAAGMRKANGWDADLAGDIAKALIDRTRRKGYYEDSAFRSHIGNDNLKEVRDILEGAGVRGDRLQRAMDVMAGVTDEAGKAAVLKHRIDIDMRAGLQMPDGSFSTVADLIDTNLTNITERYLDTVAGRSGLARKGLEDQSAIANLRKGALASIKGEAERGQAAKLFDDTVAAIEGKPVGDDMPAFMRASQAATRMVGLASSGLWQVTEYAPMMARYGAMKTLKHIFKEMPGARQLFDSVSKDVGASTQLKDILSRNSSADIRMRPFVQRLEDNFEIPASANVQLALSQAQQLVPYMNAQKFVQSHQARVMANLMVDSLVKAARGDKRAIHGFEQYGLKSHIMVELADDIKRHGMDTAKWSEGTWEKVRGPLTKAADDAVLRNRTGEIPAFAQFSQLGKFIFTFRSFVLGAHNKVLAGTLARDGLAGLSLAMLYQFPLAMLANLANATIQGKAIKDEKELVTKSFGQMGTFGLFSDLFGIISGEKQQFGAPGLIMIDRLYKTAGQAAQGNVGGAVEAAVGATPILSIMPGVRAFGAAFKE